MVYERHFVDNARDETETLRAQEALKKSERRSQHRLRPAAGRNKVPHNFWTVYVTPWL
jgi:hypothetical protein